MSGKGDTPRPVDAETYAANYVRIFRTQLYDDRREALRDKHLAEARDAIHHAPPMSPETRAKIDKTWADFDAAYPQPLDLPPKP